MIQAKVIADSKNPVGNRLTTLIVTMPRIVLAEFNTHRMFSRNSASSRAIPFEKMVKSVEENPFIPIAYQKDHKGMQGTEYFPKELKKMLDNIWLAGRDAAVQSAKNLAFGIEVKEEGEVNNIEVTKQLCNRLLEPFMWHTVIVSATEWENFFALRCPEYNLLTPVTKSPRKYRSRKDVIKHRHEHWDIDGKRNFDKYSELDWLNINKGQAEIHMMAVAEAIWDAMNESTPKLLEEGEWHIPFGDKLRNDPILVDSVDDENEFIQKIIRISTAMCARVSYTVVGEEGKAPNYENDIKLHDRLALSGHWSPFEHIARADSITFALGNFRGFVQYRKAFLNENITK